MVVFDMVGALLLIIILISVFYIVRLLLDDQKYWEKRGISSPPGSLLFGNIDIFDRQKSMVLKLVEWTKQYGKVYGIRRGLYKTLVVSDPKMLNEIFLTKFQHFHERMLAPIVGNLDTEPKVHLFNARGSRWKRLRAISNPVFSVTNLKKILPTMDHSAREMCRFLAEKAETGETFNIHTYFYELTMDIISRVAMGQEGTRQFHNQWLETARRHMEELGTDRWVLLSWILPTWTIWIYRKLFKAKMALFRSPMFELFRMIDSVVKSRRLEREQGMATNAEVQRQIDFIDLFLDAESPDLEEDQYYGAEIFDKSSVKTVRRLTPSEVSIQCFLFVLAGFDTTANSLAFSFYYLARYPEVQQLLYQEIVEIVGPDPEMQPTFEQLSQLRYADAVIREALRLQPFAAAAASRLCAKSVQIGDYWIEGGTYVQADVFSVHQDPELWGTDAATFRPERWFKLTSSQQSNWLAFGSGPRICIGMRMALLEEKLAFVQILRRFALSPENSLDEPLQLMGNGVLSPTTVSIRICPRL